MHLLPYNAQMCYAVLMRALSWYFVGAALLGIGLVAGFTAPGVAHAGKGSVAKKTKFYLRRLTCEHEISAQKQQELPHKRKLNAYCVNCGLPVNAQMIGDSDTRYVLREIFDHGLPMDNTDRLRRAAGKE